MQRTSLYKQSRDRSASFVQFSLDYCTGSQMIRVCFQFSHIGNQQQCFHQLVNTVSEFSGNRNENRFSSPLFRHNSVIGHFTFNTVRIDPRLIHFVNGNNNRNTCCLCMVNGLFRLRHNSVISSNNDNDDICYLCTSGTHCHPGK